MRGGEKMERDLMAHLVRICLDERARGMSGPMYDGVEPLAKGRGMIPTSLVGMALFFSEACYSGLGAFYGSDPARLFQVFDEVYEASPEIEGPRSPLAIDLGMSMRATMAAQRLVHGIATGEVLHEAV